MKQMALHQKPNQWNINCMLKDILGKDYGVFNIIPYSCIIKNFNRIAWVARNSQISIKYQPFHLGKGSTELGDVAFDMQCLRKE